MKKKIKMNKLLQSIKYKIKNFLMIIKIIKGLIKVIKEFLSKQNK